MSKPEKKVSVSKLSEKSQKKLEEIRQKHHLKSLDEAVEYMLNFTREKK